MKTFQKLLFEIKYFGVLIWTITWPLVKPFVLFFLPFGFVKLFRFLGADEVTALTAGAVVIFFCWGRLFFLLIENNNQTEQTDSSDDFLQQ